MRGCAARTVSANGPPPGTITARPPHSATVAVQRRRSSERAQLPPTLMTVSPSPRSIVRLRADLGIALARRAGLERAHLCGFGRPLAGDLDSDRAGPDVELL